ncbi:hypothetical protein G6Z92_19475 [Vibrio aestuarianus subsp. cardii]|uniref:hypothetical protein n=1 Tax=Vibrio aestuarianus TaxID=28171 RepID=UPI0015C57E46|nr:hypothetical protein [Vibrio aestuarianus]NGZ69084.1 hypothetical protein [Vibrio aestuarianus subsp. cardii]
MSRTTDTPDDVNLGDTMANKDKWCMPLKRKGKPTISGGAARNVRIAESGGMDNIISNAVEFALNRANLLSGSVPSVALSSKPVERDDTTHLH